MPVRALVLLLLAALSACARDGADAQRVLLGTTHTLEDSGLLTELVTGFEAAHPGHRLSVVVAGSGEVLALARRGDVDVVLSHSPEDEVAFIAAGHGEARYEVMHNDFVLLAPPHDPAAAAAANDPATALRRIAGAGAGFVSRGDDSGTHRRELALWADAQQVTGWPGYVEAGTGMADALRLAAHTGAYILADRATFEVLREELQLRLVQERDARLHNQYSVMVATRARQPAGARLLAEWLRGAEAAALIEFFGRSRAGEPLFTPSGVQCC